MNFVKYFEYAKKIGFSKQDWLETLKSTVPQKTIELNEKAFLLGYDF